MTHSSGNSAAEDRAQRASGADMRRFGPFVLRRLLGKSSLTMAWLVHDQRVRRDAMLMLPRQPAKDPVELRKWLDAAHRLSRLEHPRLAQTIDLGAWESWPYMVCERPAGAMTVGEWLAEQPWPPAHEAVSWCVDILEGLAYAHEAGFAHGDLGFHSLILDRHGRVSVWGFGLGPGEAAADGDPADALQRRHLQADAQRDVLTAGLLLHGLLAQAPVLGEPNLPTVIRRLGQEILRLPWDVPQPIPEALRTIVNRATDRHVQRRYLNARSLLRALQGWLQAHAAQDQGGALALLVERMDQVGPLPARPGLAQRITLVSGMDRQRLDDLADIVLEDPALSLELLRSVNSAQFGARQDGAVTTVRRAMQLVGIKGVRRAAGSLRNWPGPLHPEQAVMLEDAMRQAFLAGHLAELLTPAGVEPEGCLLVAQLQHLGRLLGLYHFPEDMAQIQALARPAAAGDGQGGPPIPAMSESAAAIAVLGVDLRGLAAAVVHHLGLDAGLQEMMRPLPRDRSIHVPKNMDGWIRLIASCANETLDASALAEPGRPAALAKIAGRYAKPLGCSAKDLEMVLKEAQRRLHAHLASRRGRAENRSSALRASTEKMVDEPEQR